ncbi:MAG: hypothetical protein II811_00800, partial [Spirochaetaceae bacterium]|nr:hypothetical protein [Spirochaetaceae bacterium]
MRNRLCQYGGVSFQRIQKISPLDKPSRTVFLEFLKACQKLLLAFLGDGLGAVYCAAGEEST